MLTVYRSNRAEWLAELLAQQLRVSPPSVFDVANVVVNTWPTSRWLGEQLALVNGISAQVRFPFPGSYLRNLVRIVLEREDDVEDPWQRERLVWPLIDLLPEFLEKEEALPLKHWIGYQKIVPNQLNQEQWKLARSIADAFDDYILYRPDHVASWIHGKDTKGNSPYKLPSSLIWQSSLFRLLAERIDVEPFGVLVQEAISKLRRGVVIPDQLPSTIRLFGISSLAPLQLELIQAISGITDVQMFLLTPCPDLWKRCSKRRLELGESWTQPFDGSWLLKAPRLEATLGKMGAEFQQLLEGSGESQLGQWEEGDLFAASAKIASHESRTPSLLEQLQQQLVAPEEHIDLRRKQHDSSLLFLASPGLWRETQLIRDQIIQWFAEDPTLEPRDVLVMTPQINRYAPLIASVFNDVGATGVEIPWRITDRSQTEQPGLIHGMLEFLKLANTRLTATSLQTFLGNPAIQQNQCLEEEEVEAICRYLQLTGFRWGLDSDDRNGDETYSLSWCIDRWLLGLVMPNKAGLNLLGAAPFSKGIKPNEVAKWWEILSRFRSRLKEIRAPRTCEQWVSLLKRTLDDLFGDSGSWTWERKSLFTALDDWQKIAGDSPQVIEGTVVFDVLDRALSIESGRFGHRSGALTFSALEPMRAIPHRVIILMGLDSEVFPRYSGRHGFHLLEHQHKLGDPRSSDQDRYVILEALMSSRQHLLISWNSRDEQTGESLPAASPVQQLLGQLEKELDEDSFDGLVLEPAPNPLDRSNFLKLGGRSPIACDQRLLKARRLLDKALDPKPLALAFPLKWNIRSLEKNDSLCSESLRRWLMAPQRMWLEQFQLKPLERFNPIENLERLELNELQRQALLRERLFDLFQPTECLQSGSLDDSAFGDWEFLNAGQGILPPGSSAHLENLKLEKRWQHLQSLLVKLGPPRAQTCFLDDCFQQILLAGDNVVVVQLGRLNFRGALNGWLTHLQNCVGRKSLSSTVVIARKPSLEKCDEFELALKWNPLPKDAAAENIQRLKSIAEQGLKSCFPVPPESGWAYAWVKGSSTNDKEMAFHKTWNGGYKRKGERERLEMQMCFGQDLEANQLINSEGFNQAYLSLYEPLLENLSR